MTTPRTNSQVSSHAASLEALLQQTQGTGRNSTSGDAAAFQRWMQQYRQPDAPAASPQPMPAARVVQAHVAGRSPSVRDGQTAGADLQPSNITQADTAGDTASPAQVNGQANGQASRMASKELRKTTSTARAPEQGKAAKADGASKPNANAAAEGAEKAGEASDAGEAVRFQTAQGEAMAWVKELPVPDDVAASDPAAMLAWLASLQSPAQPGAQALTDAEAGARAAGLPPAQGDTSGWQPRGASGAEALAMQALQRGQADGNSDTGNGRGDGASADEGGALPLRAMGLDETSSAAGDAAAASFASALQRELQPLSAPRSEGATRHYTGTLHTPMESPAFTQALSDRVAFWVNGPAADGPMTAELRLNPAEMGPVHIRIELDGQNAHVDFAAAAAETREAIEASLGQLSSALEESGLKLSGGGVSDQTPQQQAWAQAAAGQSNGGQGTSGRQGREPEGRWVSTGVADGVSESLGVRPLGSSRPGGLDLYA